MRLRRREIKWNEVGWADIYVSNILYPVIQMMFGNSDDHTFFHFSFSISFHLSDHTRIHLSLSLLCLMFVPIISHRYPGFMVSDGYRGKGQSDLG